MTKILATNKIISTTVASVFTEHLVIILLIDFHIPVLRRGRNEWKLNARLLRDRGSFEGFSALMERWKGSQPRYTDLNLWWVE